jgi:hypothetical protein
VNADQAEYIEYLRLFAAVKFMFTRKCAPKDTCIADDITKIAPDFVDKFRELQFNDVMMREMVPALFAPLFGMKIGDLRQLQKAYVELVGSYVTGETEN